MISFSTPSFVLRSSDVGDADRLFVLLTRDRGVLPVMAKGILKPESKLRSSIAPYMLLETYIIAQRRFTLGGSIIQQSHKNIRTSYAAFWAAEHCAEIILQLVEQEFHDQATFDLFARSLTILDRHADASGEKMIVFAVSFDLHFLSHLGLAPRFDQCAKCKKEASVVGIRSQGVYCAACSNEVRAARLSDDVRKVLMFCQQNDPEQVFRLRLQRSLADAVYRTGRILLEDHLASTVQSDVALKDI